MVTLHLSDYLVKRILIDIGSSSNLLFLPAFKEIKLMQNQLTPNITIMIKFNREASRSMRKSVYRCTPTV